MLKNSPSLKSFDDSIVHVYLYMMVLFLLHPLKYYTVMKSG